MDEERDHSQTPPDPERPPPEAGDPAGTAPADAGGTPSAEPGTPASAEEEPPRRIWDPDQRRWVAEDELRAAAPPASVAPAPGAAPPEEQAAAPEPAPAPPAAPVPVWLASLVAAAIGAVLAVVALVFFPGLIDREAAPASRQQVPERAGGVLDTIEITEGIRQATVSITVQRAGERSPVGSGLVLSQTGVIATSARSIEGAEVIAVTFSHGQAVRAEVLGVDRHNDVAIIQVRGRGLSTLLRASAEFVRLGEPVAVVSSPAETFGAVATGVVSSVGRPVTPEGGEALLDLIRVDVDAELVPPGAAMVGLDGSALAMTVSIPDGTGAVLAVPMDIVGRAQLQAVQGEDITHPWIGLATSPVPAQRGLPADTVPLVVAIVFEGSPAHEAGVRPGDLVVEIDGAPIEGALGLMKQVQDAAVGQPLTLGVLRGRELERLEMNVVVADRPGGQ